jgi:hypothetical protein
MSISLISLVLIVTLYVVWIREGIEQESIPERLDPSMSKATARTEAGSNTALWQDEFAAVKHEISVLRAELTRLAAIVKTLREQNPTTLDEAGVDTLQESVADAEIEAVTMDEWDIERMEWEIAERERAAADEMEIRKEEQVARLDRAIKQETVDSQWASKAAAHIRHALQDLEVQGSKLMDVDCRTTACRVTVVHNDPVAAEEFQMRFIPAVSDLLPKAFMTQFAAEGQGSETIVYLAREGFQIPRISN